MPRKLSKLWTIASQRWYHVVYSMVMAKFKAILTFKVT